MEETMSEMSEASETLEEVVASVARDPIGRLKKAIVVYDREAAASAARDALAQGIDPNEALGAMTAAIRLVGDGFGAGSLWLPDLVGAADAMQSAVPIIEEAIERTGARREVTGRAIIGTVFGDLHSIGKTMVAALLRADGFEVIDLGIDVPAERFVEAVRERKPDLLAMSALLTTTAPEQGKVINALRNEGLRGGVKIMVGGAAITQDFGDNIGADGYDPTAVGAVKLARRLIGK